VVGPLSDDLEMDAATRAAHLSAARVHYERILRDGAVYAQPFSEGGAAAAGAVAFGTEARPRRWRLYRQRQEDLRLAVRLRRLLRRALHASAPKGEEPSRRNTLYLGMPAMAEGVECEGDWDPLGMRGTVSRTLIFKDVFVPRTRR
jgi:hypothetical protein